MGQTEAGQESALVTILIQRAQYWLDKGRYDQVQQALGQARQVAPRDPRAIALSGQLALRMGDPDLARRMAALLHDVAPAAQETRQLDQALRLQGGAGDALEAIRAAARSGQTSAAVAGYRRLFPDGPPPQYALEYYHTLAGAVGYRDQGLTGLRNLVAADPDDVAAQIAYAQVLTWRDATRLGGLARLQRLDGLPGLSAPDRAAIRRAWRTALLWLPEAPETVPYYDAWLRLDPGDTEIGTVRGKARAAQPQGVAQDRTQGFEDLNAGRLDAAAAHFMHALTGSPNDPDALGGLGVTRMRQGRADEARDLLSRASQAGPVEAAKWRDALNGATVSGAYGQVHRLMALGHYADAQSLIDSTLAADPTQIGLVALQGDIARRRGDIGRAETLYRHVLQAQPDNLDALQGLYQILQSSGRQAQAAALTERLRRLSPAFVRQMAQSDLLARAGQAPTLDDRIGLLRQGVADQPQDPWIRLRLAQALTEAGDRAEAAEVMAPLSSPDGRVGIAALQAAIYFANQTDDFTTVRQLLQRLPRGARPPDIQRIAARAEDQQLVADAPPDLPEARLYFLQMAHRGRDPDGARGRLVADALLARGDAAGARSILEAFLEASYPPTPRQRLAYAGVYMRMQDSRHARQMLEGLTMAGHGESSLGADDLAALRSLRTGLAILASDQLNDQGRQADAFDALQPALTETQPSAAARLALARLYQSSNQPAMALSIARAVTARDPSDLDARLSVVRLALQADDLDEAEAQLREMTEQAPSDPRTWLASAVIHRAGGNWTASLGDLARARDLRLQQVGHGAGTRDGIPLDNPFRTAARRAESGGAESQDPVLRAIDSEAASTTRDYAPFVDIGPVYRTRSGTGLNQLTEGDLAMSAAFPVGPGRLTASVTPAVLSTGTGSMDYIEGLREVGVTALTGDYAAAMRRRDAVGAGLNVAYAWRWLTLDLGTSPLGFSETNILGGLSFSPQLTSTMRLRVTAERRAATDSILSYAGLHDSAVGGSWGGVVRNRLNSQLEYGDPLMNFYLRGGFAYLQGHGTPDNIEYEAGGGGGVSLYKDTVNAVRLGVDLTWFRYNNNQYLFTYGNGGYFSPQSFVSLLVPVRYAGQSGQWTWNAGASLGFQSYHSRSALFYPTSPVLQAVLDGSDPAGALSPGRSSSGLVGGANAHLSYQVTPVLRVAGDLLYQKAGPWNETTAGLSIHYSFEDGR
ncbi:cellulose synthase subunit BcsC-related outer membrane protein [Nguyenibacter sp. L1]|uniref:cellulose synthase subunit BcsC-related outer membrane protein n=1 Tax=Nguyenibacter sp. L1 TaxID=3049350 RepID=UPI002B4791C8|nr:cellulose synthase subunit BcsC-related outer membrane protein [Nguyenibacter sp. L1]WRH88485.1 cellulose synthase subunit BcsC-related outer membrane protein [Nguyenibacter sp. L1]